MFQHLVHGRQYLIEKYNESFDYFILSSYCFANDRKEDSLLQTKIIYEMSRRSRNMTNDEDMRKLLRAVSDLENQKIELTFSKEFMDEQLNIKHQELQEAYRKNQQITSHIEKFDSEIQNLTDANEVLESKIMQTMGNLTHLKSQLENERTQYYEFQAESDKVKSQLEEELQERMEKLNELLKSFDGSSSNEN